MKRKYLLGIVLGMCMLGGACSSSEVGKDIVSNEKSQIANELLEDAIKDSSKEEESNGSEKEEKGKDKGVENGSLEEKESTFAAMGETPLKDFLDRAKSNGYEIVEVENTDGDVTAKAKGKESTFDIRYLVGDERVYMVEVIAKDRDILESDSYRGCIYGMAKSLNPDIQKDGLENAVKKVFGEDEEQIVEGEILFIHYVDDNSVAMFH